MERSLKRHGSGASRETSLPAAVIEEFEQRMRESYRTTVRAISAAFALPDGVNQSVRRTVAAFELKRCPGPSRVNPRMVVGAADECLEPRTFSLWRQIVLVRESLQGFGSQSGQ